MPIQSAKELEEKLEQLKRFYRAQSEIWSHTSSTDQREIAKWVVTGGKIKEGIDGVLAEIEDYTGCTDLRVLLEKMKEVAAERSGLGLKE